ncbi:hypothetical protein CANCADRAFT_12650, partial [Tortispora caseinolytica NRRL Y-17796]
AVVDGIKLGKRQSSSIFEISPRRELQRLPSIMTVAAPHRHEIFLHQIEQCSVIFDFNDPSSDLEGKEIKRSALIDLAEYISSSRVTYTDEVYAAMIHMFSVNIFRPIPPPVNPFGDIFDPDEDEPVFEVAWPHMELVYNLFLRFLESEDFSHAAAKPYIDTKFVLQLLELFDSEDARERELLKTTLHRIYGKFLALRSFIRKSISNIFFQFMYETEHFNGIGELLEILGSIINGFALPLKAEHKNFLLRALMPLHKAHSLPVFHAQLSYCVLQFVEKDRTLGKDVVLSLLRYWPKVNSSKEVLFLSELEDIIESIEPSEFVQVQTPIFQQLSRCISSTHFQVAERALVFWCNDYFLRLLHENINVALPIFVGALENLSHGHWNESIASMGNGARAVILSNHPVFYDECHAKSDEERQLA